MFTLLYYTVKYSYKSVHSSWQNKILKLCPVSVPTILMTLPPEISTDRIKLCVIIPSYRTIHNRGLTTFSNACMIILFLTVDKYKFVVSFENADCDDYITEKFFRNVLVCDLLCL